MTCTHNFEMISKRLNNNDTLLSCTDKPNYLSVFYHRSNARSDNKCCWSISITEEGHRFYCAHENRNESIEEPGLWHIEDGNIFIGTNQELICFFPEPKNTNDFWHGYPFTFDRKSPANRIKALKEVAEKLLKQNKLSLKRVKKIRSGEL